MDINQVIEHLEREWDTTGFLDEVRRGRFAVADGEKFLTLLSQISLAEEDVVPKRFLSLVWYLPIFLSWQRERVEEIGNDVVAYDHFVTQVHNVLEEVLGIP